MRVFRINIKMNENLDMTQTITATMNLRTMVKKLQSELELAPEQVDDDHCSFVMEDAEERVTLEALQKKLEHFIDPVFFSLAIEEASAEVTGMTGQEEREELPWKAPEQDPEPVPQQREGTPAVGKKTGALDKIRSLIGGEEFKVMACELSAMGAQLAPIPDYFKSNTYLFSIDDGYGLSTALKLFADLGEELKLFRAKRVKEVRCLTDSTDPQAIERMNALLSRDLENAGPDSLVCVDLSRCYDALNRGEYRDMLKLIYQQCEGVLVFRIPFMEQRLQKQISECLNDLFYIHTVTFPPFDLDELFACGENAAKDYGFTLEADMRDIVAELIAQEKSDGKFYGIRTMKKIVSRLIYEKLRGEQDAGEQGRTICAGDFAEMDYAANDGEISAEEQLRAMVGMEGVADQVMEIVSMRKFAQATGDEQPSLHMRFVGPPGTGKTTAARLVGKIFKEHRILRTGVFFEYTGNDFIAKYVGHTAAKTAQICRDAYGGVLFIDEAYSLAHGDEEQGSFREEAMNTLLAQMENHRDDMLVIMAGYEHEMDRMISSNPGLAQRVPYVVQFRKYSKSELADIFFVMADKRFRIDEALRAHIRAYFETLPNNVYYGPNFANARFVRNLYERVLSKAALRSYLEKETARRMSQDDFDRAARDIEQTMTGAMVYGQDSTGATMFAEQETGIGFADVCGQEEAKELMAEMIDFMRNPTRYRALGAEIPKGALLYGPPGTGKTMLARAAAGEAKVPVLTISGSDLIGKYVGWGADKVRELFAQARKMAPCIIFIDEIDAIGITRTQGGTSESLMQLLAEMDGIAGRQGVMILAATNQPERLDPALRRPGRLDREIPVELPTIEGRMQILSHYLEGKAVDSNTDLREVANLGSGMSGADLKNVVNEAALRAIREHRDCITQGDLEESIEVVAVGHQKKGQLLSDKEKQVVCYHEIGHALAAALQTHSAPVKKITVLPRSGGTLGYAMQLDPDVRYLHTREELENRLVTICAGRAAEEVHFHQVTTGASNDMEKATRIARMMVTRYGMTEEFDMMCIETAGQGYLGGGGSENCSPETAARVDEKVLELVREAHRKAYDLLKENEDKLDALSGFIYEQETITGKQFMEILNRME